MDQGYSAQAAKESKLLRRPRLRFSEGVFEQDQAVVAPEHLLAEEECGHAEGAAMADLPQFGLVKFRCCRVVEAGAEGLRVQAHLRGKFR